MEIQGTDGSKTQLNPNSTTIFGRLNLSNPKDLSISRHHISITPIPSPNSPTNPRVSFQVVGKNPVWIYHKNESHGEKIKTLNRFQKGELGFDDLFCVSGKNPVWFSLIKVKIDDLGKFDGKSLEICSDFGVELSQSLEGNENCDFGLDFVDVSNIDPVREFGFLVIGHEFDQYPKKIIHDIKNWDWFLDNPIRGHDDDDESEETKGKTRSNRKRKKTSGDEEVVNEEWVAESEDEELVTKANKVSRPKYQTRSKDPSMSHNKLTRGTSSKASSKKEEDEEYDDEEDDEEDQTLGGFIVNDETVEDGDEDEDEENVIDDDDEEEFVEDEEDELEE